jgi:hypothetical protein
MERVLASAGFYCLWGIVIGPGHVQQVAKVLQEEAVVGVLGPAGTQPAGFKIGVGHGNSSGR